jgi:hypothetical protein
VGIVDALELVDVDEQESAALGVRSANLAEHAPQLLVEAPAIPHIGQRVAMSGAMKLGDGVAIAEIANHVNVVGRVQAVGQCVSIELDGELLAVPSQTAHVLRAVGVVDRRTQLSDRGADQVCRRCAEHPLRGRIGVENAPRSIAGHDAVPGRLGDAAKSLLGKGKSGHRLTQREGLRDGTLQRLCQHLPVGRQIRRPRGEHDHRRSAGSEPERDQKHRAHTGDLRDLGNGGHRRHLHGPADRQSLLYQLPQPTLMVEEIGSGLRGPIAVAQARAEHQPWTEGVRPNRPPALLDEGGAQPKSARIETPGQQFAQGELDFERTRAQFFDAMQEHIDHAERRVTARRVRAQRSLRVHLAHHLAVTVGHRLVRGRRRGNRRARPARCFDESPHEIHELGGLRGDRVGAQLHGELAVGGIEKVRARQDEADVTEPVVLPDALTQLKSVHFRHEHVAHDEIGHRLRGHRQGLDAVARRGHVQPELRELQLDPAAMHLVVFDQQRTEPPRYRCTARARTSLRRQMCLNGFNHA